MLSNQLFHNNIVLRVPSGVLPQKRYKLAAFYVMIYWKSFTGTRSYYVDFPGLLHVAY